MRILTSLALLALATAAPAAGQAPPLAWKQSDTSLALVRGDAVLWQLNAAKGENKPFFHPVTVDGSAPLTDLRPADHPWHLALWFSWKFINGLNYWEPADRKTGRMEGITEVLDVKFAPRPDHSARCELKLAYHPLGQPAVLTEQRTLEVSAPSADGGWHLDWQGTFTAGPRDVRLDRTPILGEPQGKGHGGYAGLSLRLVPALKAWRFTGSEGKPTGSNADGRWMAFSGPLGDKAATILVLDHPQSFRHPTPWYLIGGMPYFSPAALYRSPYTLPASKNLQLKYRLCFLPGPLDARAAEQAWKQFAAGR